MKSVLLIISFLVGNSAFAQFFDLPDPEIECVFTTSSGKRGVFKFYNQMVYKTVAFEYYEDGRYLMGDPKIPGNLGQNGTGTVSFRHNTNPPLWLNFHLFYQHNGQLAADVTSSGYYGAKRVSCRIVGNDRPGRRRSQGSERPTTNRDSESFDRNRELLEQSRDILRRLGLKERPL